MNARPRAARRGFTLVEMIITLCVFLLLAAAVFGIFDATLRGVGDLQDDQAIADQASALHAWMTRSLLGVPAQSPILSYRRENIPFDVADVVWQSGAQRYALDLAPQPNGHYILRLVIAPDSVHENDFISFVLQQTQGDGTLAWRPLIRDLVSADWRFRSVSDPLWHESAGGTGLSLVQFTYQVAGSNRMMVNDCWVPPLAPATTLTGAPSVTANTP